MKHLDRYIKRILKTVLLSLIFGLILSISFMQAERKTVSAEEGSKVNIYFVHSLSCPHCLAERPFLRSLAEGNPNLSLYEYEVSDPQSKYILYNMMSLGVNITAVPVTVIHDQIVSGYLNEETTGKEIKAIVTRKLQNPGSDKVGELINAGGDSRYLSDLEIESIKENIGELSDNNADTVPGVPPENEDSTIDIPIFGRIDPKLISLPLFTAILGFLDGFNPCAMWALLFLISLLLGMKDRRKMWILGVAFIFSSGFVYFLFMAAWLKIFLVAGYVLWIRYLIGIAATGLGGYNIRKYFLTHGKGCDTEDSKKRKAFLERLKRIAQKEKFVLALGGIVLLAAAVNTIELVCSAGLPAIYTKVLAMNQLQTWQYYSYLLLYIFFFMLDDLAVFIIAMVTLRAVGIESKYGKYSTLIGGIVMLVIGILLLLKPEWLMFA